MEEVVKNSKQTTKHRFKAGNKFGRGRPRKELCIPDILRKIGEEKDEKSKKCKLEAVMEMVYTLALAGNIDCIKFLAERTEGKVKETLALEGGARLTIAEEIVDAPTAT